MRKPSVLLVLAAVLGLALTSAVTWARPASAFALSLLVMGEPSAVGVLASGTGASVTNATTAVPFVMTAATLGPRVITVQCDATAFVGFGVTCGTTLAASSGCHRLTATDPPRVFILQDSTTTINVAGPAALNCVVDKLN